MWSNALRRETPPESVRGAYVTAGDLAALETAARDFSFLPRQPVHSLLGQAAQQRRGH